MAKTRNGIYYDLSESEYFVIAPLEPYAPVTFFFSSALNVDKFNERVPSKIQDARAYILKKFGVRDESSYGIFLGLIAAYTATERRGFRILWGDDEICRLENIIFPGPTPKTNG